MNPLQSAPIAPRFTQRLAEELLNEFLKSYFTGVPHASPLGAITFPQASLVFNQTTLPDPAKSLPIIHLVCLEWVPRETWFSETQKLVRVRASWSIFVRVANKGETAGSNGTDHENRKIADHVKELFECQERSNLSAKGLHRPRIVRGPTVVASTPFNVRLLVLQAEPSYYLPRT